MSQVSESDARVAIDDFKNDVAAAQEKHGTLIAELEADLLGVSWEVSESYMEFTDELAGDLGARAANCCEAGQDQEEAISTCESYVSEQVACDPMSLVSACVAFHGPAKASELIGKIVSESPIRTGMDVSL